MREQIAVVVCVCAGGLHAQRGELRLCDGEGGDSWGCCFGKREGKAKGEEGKREGEEGSHFA